MSKKTIDDAGAKALAGAVLIQTAKDIHARQNAEYKGAERHVREGGVDLYLDLLDVDMDHETFIKLARERRR